MTCARGYTLQSHLLVIASSMKDSVVTMITNDVVGYVSNAPMIARLKVRTNRRPVTSGLYQWSTKQWSFAPVLPKGKYGVRRLQADGAPEVFQDSYVSLTAHKYSQWQHQLLQCGVS